MSLKDCFTFRPTFPKGLPQMYTAINNGIEVPYDDGQNCLSILLQTTPSQKSNVFSFILNLDYHTATPESAEKVPLDNASEWIELAHTRITYAFDKCLTAKCKAKLSGR
jgi:hypothetical protein